MINEPTITASCDKCDYTTDPMEMCALAGGGYDDRYIEGKLKRDGWTVVNGMHLCEECSAEAEDDDTE